jgi:hypothetical protein
MSSPEEPTRRAISFHAANSNLPHATLVQSVFMHIGCRQFDFCSRLCISASSRILALTPGLPYLTRERNNTARDQVRYGQEGTRKLYHHSILDASGKAAKL